MYTSRVIILVISFLSLLTGCSNFYVKVIDQYGEPVPDVKVQVGSLSNFFIVAGSRTAFKTSSRNGRFTVGGSAVGMEFIEKNGYEFSYENGYGSVDIRGNYKREHGNSYFNPYHILAWKRDVPERLISGGSRLALKPHDDFREIVFTDRGTYKPNGYIYLKKINNSQSIESLEGTLLVRYVESSEVEVNHQGKEMHPWQLTLAVPQGGLQENDTIFNNLAPKEGYQQQWSIDSKQLSNVSDTVIKNFFLKSKNGKVYGSLYFRFNDHHRLVTIKYRLNENASRNLTRPKRYIYCKSQFSPKDCSLDDYNP